MASKVDPIKPENVDVEPEEIDVTEHVQKINTILCVKWTESERRCGRGYNLGEDPPQAVVDELKRTFRKWDVSESKERRGTFLTFKMPRDPEADQKRRLRYLKDE